MSKTSLLGKEAQGKISKVMGEFAEGQLKSGGRVVKSRKQALAIAFSEARRLSTPKKPRGK